MVKIINGEIYQDNDPRLKQLLAERERGAASSQNAAAHASAQPRQRGVRGLHDPPPEATAQGTNAGGNAAAVNPIDSLAKLFKIENIKITVPAVPLLGITASTIGLIYFVLLGVAFLIFGVKALLFGAVTYVMYKHGERTRSGTNN